MNDRARRYRIGVWLFVGLVTVGAGVALVAWHFAGLGRSRRTRSGMRGQRPVTASTHSAYLQVSRVSQQEISRRLTPARDQVMIVVITDNYAGNLAG